MIGTRDLGVDEICEALNSTGRMKGLERIDTNDSDDIIINELFSTLDKNLTAKPALLGRFPTNANLWITFSERSKHKGKRL
jgi:hypothetical protein